MKMIKRITLTGITSLGLIAGTLQVAHSAPLEGAKLNSAYKAVQKATANAAKDALGAKLTGKRAACYIANIANITSLKAGFEPKSTQTTNAVARSTFQAGNANKIRGVTTRNVSECTTALTGITVVASSILGASALGAASTGIVTAGSVATAAATTGIVTAGSVATAAATTGLITSGFALSTTAAAVAAGTIGVASLVRNNNSSDTPPSP